MTDWATRKIKIWYLISNEEKIISDKYFDTGKVYIFWQVDGLKALGVKFNKNNFLIHWKCQ